MAHRLSQIYPHLIHIEESSFVHPTWQHVADLYNNNYNLSDNYSIHLYLKKLYYIPDIVEDLDGYNCTVGAAMRMVLYGSPKLRRNYNITVGYHLQGKTYIQEKLEPSL